MKENKLLFLGAAGAVFLTEFLQSSRQGILVTPLNPEFWVNLLFALSAFLLLKMVLRRSSRAIAVGTVVFFLLGAVNFYTISLRTTSLLPWDIFAAQTAMNVLPSMKFEIPDKVAWSAIYTAFVVLLCIRHRGEKPKKGAWKRQGGAAIALFAAFCLIVGLCRNFFYINSWDQTYASRKNGLVVNLALNMWALGNWAPSGYTETKAQALLSSYKEPEKTDFRPNVIVIMDESFADLTYNGDIKADRDVMPNIRRIMKESVSGRLVVPIFGGGTCNTEYEFLTGNTCAFLQPGAYPMQMYVHKETPSVASDLKKLGYRTVALHPYYPNGWGRARAYPLMGFDTFLSLDDFAGAERLRSYVSDRASFQKIIEEYESKPEGVPLFAFNVTMQNHNGYDTPYSNLEETVSFDGEEEYPKTHQWLALIEHTDKAVQELLDYFSAQDEPTVLLFFGDHQPPIEDAFYDKLFEGSGLQNEEIALRKYSVPFFIWTNYDIEPRDVGYLSSNYLSSLLMKEAGLPQNNYQQFLEELSERYPVISTAVVMDASGALKTVSEAKEDLQDYHYLVYNHIFD